VSAGVVVLGADAGGAAAGAPAVPAGAGAGSPCAASGAATASAATSAYNRVMAAGRVKGRQTTYTHPGCNRFSQVRCKRFSGST
jgi:hypothetical protein